MDNGGDIDLCLHDACFYSYSFIDDNSEASRCGAQASSSSESWDAFNLPQIKKIKSMTDVGIFPN